jgi:uncharacterized protein with GYD domain
MNYRGNPKMLRKSKYRPFYLLLALLFSSSVFAGKQDLRHFMFIGEPNAKAWQYLMDNPQDRKMEVEGAFKALGGEVISYYFGLGNGKNYITVTIPNDNELIQAIYLMRLPSGLLKSYKVIELMPSKQMSEALKRSKKLIEGDSTVKK